MPLYVLNHGRARYKIKTMNPYEIGVLIIAILGLIVGILTLFGIGVRLRHAVQNALRKIYALRNIWVYVRHFLKFIKSRIVPILIGMKGRPFQCAFIVFLTLLLGGISYGVYTLYFDKGHTSTPEEGADIAPVLSPITNDDGGEYVIRSTAKGFNAPGRLTQGIVWDGTYLWVSDNSAEIFKVDTNGRTLGAYSAPAPTPEGLTWDGSTFWIFTTNYGYIYQFSIDESGNVPKIRKIGSFESPAQTFGAINHGLAWDGANLWFSDYYNIYKIDTEGNVLSNFAFPHETAGLAWDSEKLWIAYNSFPENATLVITDTEGNILGSFTAPVYHIDALTWGDGYLWAAGKGSLGGESMIYKIEVYTEVSRERK